MTATKKPRPMPKWQPAPNALVRRFETALQSVPAAHMRKMFGYPAAFINGHMLSALFQDNMIVRLSPDDRTSLLQHPGAKPFEPMPGRAMREYVVLPSPILNSSKELGGWLRKAEAYVGSLPPKAHKPKRSKS